MSEDIKDNLLTRKDLKEYDALKKNFYFFVVVGLMLFLNGAGLLFSAPGYLDLVPVVAGTAILFNSMLSFVGAFFMAIRATNALSDARDFLRGKKINKELFCD